VRPELPSAGDIRGPAYWIEYTSVQRWVAAWLSDGQMRALILVHIDGEGAALLGSVLASQGIACHELKLYRGDPVPRLEDYDLMLVMGGPEQVWERKEHAWLGAETDAIRRWVEELERPYFGICLGHQLLAAAFGGEVAPAARYELGFPLVNLTEDGIGNELFGVLPPSTRWLQWHTAEVTEAPAGFEIMASSADCKVQVINRQNRVVSLQFHAEGEEGLVQSWASQPETVAELTALDGAAAAVQLSDAAGEHLDEARRCACVLFQHWLELNGLASAP